MSQFDGLFWRDEDGELQGGIAGPEGQAEPLAMPQQMTQAPPEFVPPQQAPMPQGLSPEQGQGINERSAALNALQAGSQGAGNVANIFRPGAVDQNATAQLFRQYQAQVAQPRVDADSARKKAIEDQQISDVSALRGQQTQGASLKNKQTVADNDPNSPESKQYAESFKQQWEAVGSAMGGNAPEYAAVASNSKGKSKSELVLLNAQLEKKLGLTNNANLAANNAGYRERMLAAQEKLAGIKGQDTDTDNQLQREKFEFEKDKPAKDEIKVRFQQQEKLNTTINNSSQAVENMKQIGKLKDKVNTGFITKLWSDWIGKPFDIVSAERVDMESLLARTFNRETKELAGSAVTPSEWARIAPQIPEAKDDDNVFRRKLGMALQISEEILAKRKEEYQLNEKTGKPLDASTTAANASKSVARRVKQGGKLYDIDENGKATEVK